MGRLRFTTALAAGAVGLCLTTSRLQADHTSDSVCLPAPAECRSIPQPRVIVNVPTPEVIFREAPPVQVEAPCAPPVQQKKHCFKGATQPFFGNHYGAAPYAAPPAYGAAPMYSPPLMYGAAPMYIQPIAMPPVAPYGAPPPCQNGYGSQGDNKKDIDELKEQGTELSNRVDAINKRIEAIVELVKEHDKILKEHDDWIKKQDKK